MIPSQDYESSSEDDQVVNELPKPIFIRPRQTCPKRINKPHTVKKSTKPSFTRQPPRPLIYEPVINKSGETKNRKSYDNSSHSRQEYLFEYGQPVNGYKFLTTYDDMRLSMFNPKTPPLEQESSHTQKYWDLLDLKMLPVDPSKKINKDNVHAFYKESCHLLNQDLKGILKKERIRWHPDRMHLPEATHIFQIINDLWESLLKN